MEYDDDVCDFDDDEFFEGYGRGDFIDTDNEYDEVWILSQQILVAYFLA